MHLMHSQFLSIEEINIFKLIAMATTSFIILWICLLVLCMPMEIIDNKIEKDLMPVFKINVNETTDGWLKQMQGIQWSIFLIEKLIFAFAMTLYFVSYYLIRKVY